MDKLIFGSYILKGRSPVTLNHGKPDHEATRVRHLFFNHKGSWMLSNARFIFVTP